MIHVEGGQASANIKCYVWYGGANLLVVPSRYPTLQEDPCPGAPLDQLSHNQSSWRAKMFGLRIGNYRVNLIRSIIVLSVRDQC